MGEGVLLQLQMGDIDREIAFSCNYGSAFVPSLIWPWQPGLNQIQKQLKHT